MVVTSRKEIVSGQVSHVGLSPWRRVLVADTDPAIGRLLGRGLPARGFQVEVRTSASAALSLIAASRPDVVIVGGDLPDMGGLELVDTIRRDLGLPLLMLVVGRDDAATVEALDAGADDCMSKPFLMDELAARLRKLVRHALAQRGQATTIRADRLEIDCVRWRVRLGGRDTRLSEKEFAILRMLVEELGNVVSLGDLLRRVWGTERPDRMGRVRGLVRRLRTKLGMTSGSAARIEAERQIGYRLVVATAKTSATTTEVRG
jgi:two-component system, OmpR family, KDP operon response regulator KdpE